MALHIPETLGVFALTAFSIFLEAAPFLLLAALISGAIEEVAPAERMGRLFPKNPLAGVGVGLVLGMVFPTCECGVVPVVRRLLLKGAPPAAAMTFMLAAPVVNPVTMASTLVAFRGDPSMLYWRVGLVVLVAGSIGLALRRLAVGELLRPDSAPAACGCGAGCGHGGAGQLTELTPRRGLFTRLYAALGHALAEFLGMGALLAFGAIIAATFKTFLPYAVFDAVQNNVFLAIPVMAAMAVFLSLCSEADAFVAASFQSFPFAAKLVFLTLGPMVDAKLILMYRSVFTPRIVRVLILVPPTVLVALTILHALFLKEGGV